MIIGHVKSMGNNFELSNNKIGAAIQYFRESYGITQGKLCKGLCSIATLSRIEAGERDVDSLLLETLLERLGRMPNQFELILTDFDYLVCQKREEIKGLIRDKDWAKVHEQLQEYEQITASKGSVHLQFIVYCKALLNETQGGAPEETINLLMEAISYTVPDFKTHRIKDYYLSSSELGIIIDILQRMISAGFVEGAKDILEQVLEYLESQSLTEDSIQTFTKVAVIACNLYILEGDYSKAQMMCDKGLEKSKGSRRMDYLGDLFYIKAMTIEVLQKEQNNWAALKEECIKYYLQAYHVYHFFEETTEAESIKKHLEEEYQWADID
jgi:transcriptional regulator with XRE-family HTH domain